MTWTQTRGGRKRGEGEGGARRVGVFRRPPLVFGLVPVHNRQHRAILLSLTFYPERTDWSNESPRPSCLSRVKVRVAAEWEKTGELSGSVRSPVILAGPGRGRPANLDSMYWIPTVDVTADGRLRQLRRVSTGMPSGSVRDRQWPARVSLTASGGVLWASQPTISMSADRALFLSIVGLDIRSLASRPPG